MSGVTVSKPASNEFAKTARVYRGKLERLCRLRYDTHFLPDSDDGRALLTGLLHFDLTNEATRESAPWLTDVELRHLRRRARKMKWREVGPLIRLTYAEREECRLWLDPCDVSPEEVKRRQIEKDKERDRERKRRKRAEERKVREDMRAAKDRGTALLLMLEGGQTHFPLAPGVIRPPSQLFLGGWMPVSALVELAEKSRAFRRPDGGLLGNMRHAIHCTIKQLADRGKVETKREPGQRGMVLMVRKAVDKPANVGKVDANSDRRSVANQSDAEVSSRSMVSVTNGAPNRASAQQ